MAQLNNKPFYVSISNHANNIGGTSVVDNHHSDPDKVAPIINHPAPTDIKQVESFLGMCNVYHRFLARFAIMSAPLRQLKKKDQNFHWGQSQQDSFEELKQDLAALPILRQPNFSLPFELHSDAASSKGIAVILCQRSSDSPYPLSIASRSLSPAEQNYSVQELEALAIYWAVKKFGHYLKFSEVTVYTDHSSLVWLLDTKQERQGRLWRWSIFLNLNQFNI
jgi:hypothetical protein